MTLCIVWRTQNDVHFLSDSRLSFGKVPCDVGIKVCRLPYKVYGPSACNGAAPLVASGDIGMAFAGSSTVALMMKEAIGEVIHDMQGIPQYHDFSMDEIADVISRGFTVVAKSIATALFEKAATCVVFAGFCHRVKALRTYRMEFNHKAVVTCNEVLQNAGDIEIFGSGANKAEKLLAKVDKPNQHDYFSTMESVINDENITDVGGNIQYGHFTNSSFQPVGVASLSGSDNGVSYWRGPLDLNGSDFDQANGLIPLFPYLDKT